MMHDHRYLFSDGWKLIVGYIKFCKGLFSAKFISLPLVSGDGARQLHFFMRVEYSCQRISWG